MYMLWWLASDGGFSRVSYCYYYFFLFSRKKMKANFQCCEAKVGPRFTGVLWAPWLAHFLHTSICPSALPSIPRPPVERELLSYNVNLALVNADALNVLYGEIRTSYVFNCYWSFQPYLLCSFSQQIPVGSYKYSNPFSHHKFLHSDRHCRPLSILWHLEKEETTSLLQTSPMQI